VSVTTSTLLEEALAGWVFAREGFSAEAQAIPEASWDYRPHPNAKSVQELVVHILQSGEMMVGELTRPNGDFTRQSLEAHFAEHAHGIPEDAAREPLVGLLASRLTEGLERFQAVGEIHMLQRIRQFDGTFATRLSWFQHGIAHEEYHRGQLATYARCLGRVPALTQLIYGAEAE
jgi:uncharacterized damage-inducible protein DinB